MIGYHDGLAGAFTMAVEHMVWMKFHEGVTPKRIAEHLANLRALKGRVPAILEVKAGANFTERSGGFTHGLIVTVADRAGLKAYLEHPTHVEAAAPLKADAELRAMDIEV